MEVTMEGTDTTIHTAITVTKKNKVLMRQLAKELLIIGAITENESDLIITTANGVK